MKLRWKIIIAIGLALVTVLILNAETRPTVGMLADFYRTTNEDYFYGGLPVEKTKIVLVDLSQEHLMGKTEHLKDSWLISIDIFSHPFEKEAEFTEAHEMCHQWNEILHRDEGPDKHGPVFQKCMLKLAQEGAFKDLW